MNFTRRSAGPLATLLKWTSNPRPGDPDDPDAQRLERPQRRLAQQVTEWPRLLARFAAVAED